MNYSDFLTQVQRLTEETMDDRASVQIHSVLKNNSTRLDGLVILHPEENISPTIYLNNYYEDYLHGTPMDDIVQEITQVYETNRCSVNIDTNPFDDFERIKGRIYFRLINYDRNKELLSDLPHLPFLDLAIVFFLTIENDYFGLSTALIHNEHLKKWGSNPKDIFSLAFSNTKQRFGHSILSLGKMIQQLTAEDPLFPVSDQGDDYIFVLTNHDQIYGSACMIYPDILRDFSLQQDDDFYILPSSIHELILVPRKKSPAPERLKEMVREVNITGVAPDEVLSNQVYLYDKNREKLQII